MPMNAGELDSQVNPESGFDRGVFVASLIAWPLIALLLALGVIPTAGKLEYLLGPYLLVLGVCGTYLVCLSVLIIRALRMGHSSRVVKAALLAMFGGPALTFVVLLLILAPAGMLQDLVARFVGLLVLAGGAIGSVFVGCYWSGYRFGLWGTAWGAVCAMPYAAMAIMFLSEFRVMPLTVEAGAAALLTGLGALGGAMGAARFQRHLVEEAWRMRGTSPPNTSPPP